jgi:DNA-binding SARP family transcriptional activator
MIGSLRFALLGPVRVWRGEQEVTPGDPQCRVVLAALLLRAGSPVSGDELNEAVRDTEPAAAEWSSASPHEHIRHLRQSLDAHGVGPPLIHTVGEAYRIDVPAGALDLMTFQDLVALADRRHAEGRALEAVASLRSALALWQGRPLDGVPGGWADRQRRLLAAQHLTAVEARISAEVAAGTGQDHTAELRELVAEHPLDERFRELLMLALRRADRPEEALDVYRDAQRALASELGVDPGPGLRRLRQTILARPRTASRRAVGRGLPGPRQLPALGVHLCGRRTELAQAERTVRESLASGAVVAVEGAAGIGKTAFALALAHRLAPEYPDGQLHADLKASDERGSDRGSA